GAWSRSWRADTTWMCSGAASPRTWASSCTGDSERLRRVRLALELEAQVVADAAHRHVAREDGGDDALQLPVAADVDQPREQGAAEALPLHDVADQERELAVARPLQPGQPRHRHQPALELGDQRHLPVVVDEAEPGQASVR